MDTQGQKMIEQGQKTKIRTRLENKYQKKVRKQILEKGQKTKNRTRLENKEQNKVRKQRIEQGSKTNFTLALNNVFYTLKFINAITFFSSKTCFNATADIYIYIIIQIYKVYNHDG